MKNDMKEKAVSDIMTVDKTELKKKTCCADPQVTWVMDREIMMTTDEQELSRSRCRKTGDVAEGGLGNSSVMT